MTASHRCWLQDGHHFVSSCLWKIRRHCHKDCSVVQLVNNHFTNPWNLEKANSANHGQIKTIRSQRSVAQRADHLHFWTRRQLFQSLNSISIIIFIPKFWVMAGWVRYRKSSFSGVFNSSSSILVRLHLNQSLLFHSKWCNFQMYSRTNSYSKAVKYLGKAYVYYLKALLWEYS